MHPTSEVNHKHDTKLCVLQDFVIVCIWHSLHLVSNQVANSFNHNVFVGYNLLVGNDKLWLGGLLTPPSSQPGF